MSPNPLQQNLILNKEAAIGAIRELPVDESYIWPMMAPLTNVESDDVIFSYAVPEVYGLAPARAEDAEAVIARRDDTAGLGRASTIDWAIKDTYSASSVTRYREFLAISEQIAGGNLPLVTNMANEFAAKVARDQNRRRKALDARLESLFIQGLEFGEVTYDDGAVMFRVDYRRPANQSLNATPTGNDWGTVDADPIRDFIDVKQHMYDTHGTTIGTAIMSEKTLLNAVVSTRFAQMGMTPGDTVAGRDIDPYYALGTYGLAAVKAKLEAATGIRVVTYDAGRRVRPLGSTTTTFQRFMTEGKIVFLPSDADIAALNDLEFGFAATLTSPHPEGGFTPGFYAWEKEERDPWRLSIGTGIKAFPIMPHLEYTFVFKAHDPSGSVGPWTQPGAPTPV